MRTYAIDFETFYTSKYSLSGKYGLPAVDYVRHELFNPYLASVCGVGLLDLVTQAGLDDLVKGDWYGEDDLDIWVGDPRLFCWELIVEDALWVSHNAYFDATVYCEMLRRDWIFKDSPDRQNVPDQWCCSAGASRYYQGPSSLKMCCDFWFGIKVDKDIRDEMKGKVDTSDEVKEYAAKDAIFCLKLWNRLNLPESERWIQNHQMWNGIQGVTVDVELLNAGKKKLELELFKAEKAIPWEGKAMSRKLLAAECEKLGIPAPTTTKADAEEYHLWLEAFEDSAPFIRSINDVRVGNKTLRLLELASSNLDEENRRSFELVYFGANATGRFSGGSRFNLQTLPKKERLGVDVRRLFTAPEGYSFVIWDLSQIEPRVGAVVTGDLKFLDLLRNGLDVYEAHARTTMSYDNPLPLAEVDSSLRNLAKSRVLGLTYGAGAGPFVSIAKTYGVDLDPAVAGVEVKRFRNSNPLLTRRWKLHDRSLKEAVGGDYRMELLSGRSIYYRGLHYSGGNVHCTLDGGKSYRKFWGSKAYENEIQGTARDAFMLKVRMVEDAGIPVLWTVHDEGISVVPEGKAQEYAEEIKRIVKLPISWLGDCPINCSTEISKFYKK